MSTRDLHEYVPGQYQDVTRLIQEPAGIDIKAILDAERVRLAGYNIELWDSPSGGVQLILGTDYALEYKDDDVSMSEGFDVFGGYLITTQAYQGVNLYLTARIVGGYTFRPYRPAAITVSADTVLTMSTLTDMAVIADTTGGSIKLTLPSMDADELAENSMVTVIPKGEGLVTVTHPTLAADVVLVRQAGSFVYADAWIAVGASGGGSGGGGMAVGEVSWWPGTGAPDASKLVCDGALYSPDDYPSLFAKLGTTYGGDGVATFGVPNLQGITPGAFGTQDVNGNTKGDGTAIGGIREDQDQLITGEGSRQWSYKGDAPIGTGVFGTLGAITSERISPVVASGYSVRFDSSLVSRTGDYSRSTELVGRWIIQAFDSVTEIPADPALIKDYVLKWQSATPTNNVPFVWEDGVFFIGVQFTYNGVVERSNGLTAIFNDGVDRYFILSADFSGSDSTVGVTYNGTARTLSAISAGPDYTEIGIIAIYRFESVSTAVLPVPDDGWELKFRDWTNTAAVPNTWGDGQYRAVIRQTSGSLIVTSEVYIDRINTVLTVFSGTVASSNYLTGVSFSSVTGDFTVVSGTGIGYIAEIWKFTGMVQVRHTFDESISAMIDAKIAAAIAAL